MGSIRPQKSRRDEGAHVDGVDYATWWAEGKSVEENDVCPAPGQPGIGDKGKNV